MEDKEESYEIYRCTTVGVKLKETLDEMLRAREITQVIYDKMQ